MKLLLVEDERELAEWLIKALTQSRFVVQWANDGRVAEKILALEEFDAVILDLGVPGKSGNAVLQALRAAENSVPVLVLTARVSIAERVSCLDQGADDFLPKPFALAELEARLHALVRRSRGRAHPHCTCGPLSFSPRTRQFFLASTPLALTKREHALLTVLIQHSGEPVAKTYLLDRVFSQSDDVTLEAIEVVIYRLRKKLAEAEIRIGTVRGFGYCLEAGASPRE